MGCTHNCDSCSEKCGKESFLVAPHETSHIKKVIAVVSGKGGVGKSFAASALASAMNKKGYKTAVLDADITGPSIPKYFGASEKAQGTEAGLFPVMSRGGIKLMSINFLLKNDTDPVVWRGPVIAGTVKQFWTDVLWEDVDYMFVDMPPGTGDVPLTVFQSFAIDGIVVVTSPQELVSMIVEKAVKMANMMDIPVLGIIENMSYFVCLDCNKKHSIFGESHIDAIAAQYGIEKTAKLPINPQVAALCDSGNIEQLDSPEIMDFATYLEQK